MSNEDIRKVITKIPLNYSLTDFIILVSKSNLYNSISLSLMSHTLCSPDFKECGQKTNFACGGKLAFFYKLIYKLLSLYFKLV